jgi:hypothetical protein
MLRACYAGRTMPRQSTMPRPRAWASRRLVGGLAVLGWLWGGVAQAALLTFTDQALFQNAISSSPGQSTLDFEDPPLAAGTTLMSGDSAGGITFTFALGGLDVIVTNQFHTTSGTQYLGLDDGGDALFFSGDALTLGFSGPRHAVGLFVIGTPGDVQDGDVVLSVSAGSVMNTTTMPMPSVLPDGGEAFFLGLVQTDSALGFTSATLASLGDISNPTFFWSADDITTAGRPTTVIPEPGTLVLLGTGMLGLVLTVRTSRSRGGRASRCRETHGKEGSLRG